MFLTIRPTQVEFTFFNNFNVNFHHDKDMKEKYRNPAYYEWVIHKRKRGGTF
jgi:hypothetical protein